MPPPLREVVPISTETTGDEPGSGIPLRPEGGDRPGVELQTTPLLSAISLAARAARSQ